MERIQVLPAQVSQLIAAGEVVERPASVVKELMENAIDAGSTVITVEISGGGVDEICVADNGSGMSAQDAETCFLRHATSKIHRAEDIGAVLTLGFRGEALASIAAVAQITLITRLSDATEGTKLVLNGGVVEEKSPVGAPSGTTIRVKNLFYNTPARKKFLHSERAETGAISALMDKLALSHPEISFRYAVNGKRDLFTPGDGKIESAVLAVFGSQVAASMLPVQSDGEISVSGLVGKPIAARGNRNQQYFFINQRAVVSPMLSKALESAYAGSLMIGKYPTCALFLSIDPKSVDVNVHPAKSIVKFSDEKSIYGAVYGAVSCALGTVDQLHTAAPAPTLSPEKQARILAGYFDAPSTQPTFTVPAPALDRAPNPLERKPEEKTSSASALAQAPVSAPKEAAPAVSEVRYQIREDLNPQGKIATFYDPAAALEDPRFQQAPPRFEVEKPKPEPTPEPESLVTPEIRYVGEIFHMYLIVEVGEEVCFVDKHAAHERLLFEKFKQQAYTPAVQPLLADLTVSLNREDKASVLENRELFAQCGFEIEDYGGNALMVRSIPCDLSGEDVADVLEQSVAALAEKRSPKDRHTRILETMACKAAVKGGQPISQVEIQALLKKLFSFPDVKYCPHGRPIVYTMNKRDFDKFFKRIV